MEYVKASTTTLCIETLACTPPVVWLAIEVPGAMSSAMLTPVQVRELIECLEAAAKKAEA